jgi:protein subunit release factor A
MEKFEIIALSSAFAILAVRIYQKYMKKKKDKIVSDRMDAIGSLNTSSAKDDDYEPYAKK